MPVGTTKSRLPKVYTGSTAKSNYENKAVDIFDEMENDDIASRNNDLANKQIAQKNLTKVEKVLKDLQSQTGVSIS